MKTVDLPNVCCSVLQRVAACCSVLQRVAACCSVLQRVAACCSVLRCEEKRKEKEKDTTSPLARNERGQKFILELWRRVQSDRVECPLCCSVLQCVAVCCSVLQCVAACCSVLQRVAACCSVLQ